MADDQSDTLPPPPPSQPGTVGKSPTASVPPISPVAPSRKPPPPSLTPGSPAGAARKRPSASGKAVVLVLDDSQFSLSQVTKALGADYEIVTASGGAEGLTKLESHTPDLVITDLLMPHISGLAFLGQTRARHPNTKVIVVSADVQDATAAKVRALGAAAFLSKPVNPEELQRVVRLVLAHRELPADMPIDPRYADAFREIFNIGIGRAASALSKLVYETVKLSVPRLDILRLRELRKALGDTFEGELAVVKQDFSGAAAGSAYLLLSKQAGVRLVNALVNNASSDAVELVEADRGLLVEVGNILINALVGSMANTLGIEFDLSPAVCSVGEADLIENEGKLLDSDYVLFVETLFLLPGRHIGGNLVILLGSSEMATVLKGIDRVF